MVKVLKQIIEYFLKVGFKLFFYSFGSKEDYLEASKVATLYQGSGFGETFIYIRFWDSPILELVKLIGEKDTVLDLGCGDGFLANYLGFKSKERKITGIELSKERIHYANKKLSNVTFVNGNIIEQTLPPSDTILLIHVLHHLPSFLAQEDLLKRCSKALNKDGHLVIVEIDKKPFFKYLLTLFVDSFIVPILFEGRIFNNAVFFRNQKQWVSLLKKVGFTIDVIPAHSGKPFSHIILNCSKIT